MKRLPKGLLATLLLPMVVAVAVADYPIAGAHRFERPHAAPQIMTFDRPNGWFSTALHGVSRPYPNSLRFLEDQANWHTPFNRPGMPGRYDIRGWHQK
jgi:hypothetical protein